ncbi:MAG: ribosomal protein S18-alanine N-acetyltransferase [Clostridia bacterium]|nr:ribosomal protein S18-alanine N-acetyltransferase [Clostridia bacterium]
MEYGRLGKDMAADAAELEALCLYTGWSSAQIAEATEREDTLYLAATEGGVLCAVASTVFSLYEGMVENVAVHPNHRRRGIAERLMAYIEAEAVRRGVERLCLEVASRNSGAIALYEKAGYKAAGLRKGFYARQRDDAVVMVKELV